MAVEAQRRLPLLRLVVSAATWRIEKQKEGYTRTFVFALFAHCMVQGLRDVSVVTGFSRIMIVISGINRSFVFSGVGRRVLKLPRPGFSLYLNPRVGPC